MRSCGGKETKRDHDGITSGCQEIIEKSEKHTGPPVSIRRQSGLDGIRMKIYNYTCTDADSVKDYDALFPRDPPAALWIDGV